MMKKNSKIWIKLLLVIGVFLMFTSSCKKDDDPITGDTVTDIDGNVYHTVTIGTQVWMVENLKTTKYSNGDPITSVTDKTAWAALKTEGQCDYDNYAPNSDKYGKFYNWYAVHDSRNIAPSGWHVPTEAEWTTLTDYVIAEIAHSDSIAKPLASKTDWGSPLIPVAGAVGTDLTKNNATGFTALPSGYRFNTGVFNNRGYSVFFWSSEEKSVTEAWYRYMGYQHRGLGKGSFTKSYGFSVRCLKDL